MGLQQCGNLVCAMAKLWAHGAAGQRRVWTGSSGLDGTTTSLQGDDPHPTAGPAAPEVAPLAARGQWRGAGRVLTFPGRGSFAAWRRPSTGCGGPSAATAPSAGARWNGSCARRSCPAGQFRPRGCARFPVNTRKGGQVLKRQTGPSEPALHFCAAVPLPTDTDRSTGKQWHLSGQSGIYSNP